MTQSVCPQALYAALISILPPSINSTSFSNDSDNYIVELILADNNTTPVNYKLARVKQINNLGNTSSTTKYRAYIEDLCLKNNYCDQVKLVLRHKNSGTTSTSSPFWVKDNLGNLTTLLLDTGMPLVVINTVNNEEPTCEYVSPSDGCLGLTIGFILNENIPNLRVNTIVAF